MRLWTIRDEQQISIRYRLASQQRAEPGHGAFAENLTYARLLRWWGRWRKIKSPKSARHLLASGWSSGPALGQELNRLRREAQDKS